MAPKKKQDAPKVTKPSPTERYDYSRTQPADPMDPRTVGAPCFGHHVTQAPGPGSRSGSNKFAVWEACEVCQLRLSYTAAFGATGATRKAGPLKADTEAQVSRIPPNELPNNRNLKDEKIMMDGAEASLLRKLEKVQAQKKQFEAAEDAKQKNMEEKTLKGYAAASATAKAAASLGTTSTTRKSRKPETTAEDHEAQVIAVGDEVEDWTPLP